MLHGLELEYVINGQRSARRQIKISGDHIMSGNVHANLVNMPNIESSSGGAKMSTQYITSQDLNKLIYESSTNIVASVITDSDYVDTGDDVSVSKLIEQELTRERVLSTQLQPHMWESVFWSPLWARPDKLTSSLNQMLSKDETSNNSLVLTDKSNNQVY